MADDIDWNDPRVLILLEERGEVTRADYRQLQADREERERIAAAQAQPDAAHDTAQAKAESEDRERIAAARARLDALIDETANVLDRLQSFCTQRSAGHPSRLVDGWKDRLDSLRRKRTEHKGLDDIMRAISEVQDLRDDADRKFEREHERDDEERAFFREAIWAASSPYRAPRPSAPTQSVRHAPGVLHQRGGILGDRVTTRPYLSDRR